MATEIVRHLFLEAAQQIESVFSYVMLPIHFIFLQAVADEAALDGRAGAAEDEAAARARDIQLLARAGDADIKKSALLLQLELVVH